MHFRLHYKQLGVRGDHSIEKLRKMAASGEGLEDVDLVDKDDYYAWLGLSGNVLCLINYILSVYIDMFYFMLLFSIKLGAI